MNSSGRREGDSRSVAGMTAICGGNDMKKDPGTVAGVTM